MVSCTPQLFVETCFVLNADGRILSTREPSRARGPLFFLARGAGARAWAVRSDVSRKVAHELDRIAADEPPTSDFRAPPRNVDHYLGVLAKLGGSARSTIQSAGPAFAFPDSVPEAVNVVEIDDESLLAPPFSGWVRGEIKAGRSPALAVLENNRAVSVCFCARRSATAAEAGVETTESHRRRGLGASVTAAWARAIRAGGRMPSYSTVWTNEASLGIARKLGLIPYASSWSLELAG